jgi:2-polyprenyl-3-methyl-5-hydroxy-6-metoxy-1,4-benzoquinol methylase
MSNSIENWKEFGEKDPYYGVLSDEKFKINNINEETLKEFFSSGEEYVEELNQRLKNGFNISLEKMSVLDFGCGLGRLSIPLANASTSNVVGIDISPEILEIAKNHAKEYKTENVDFLVYDGENLPDLPSFDLVNSYIVLQHIEKSKALDLIVQLMEKVKIGGFAYLQVTHGHQLPILKYWNFYLRTQKPLYNFLYSSLKNKKFCSEPVMQMNLHDKNKLKNVFQKYSSNVLEFETNHGGFLRSFYLLKREF